MRPSWRLQNFSIGGRDREGRRAAGALQAVVDFDAIAILMSFVWPSCPARLGDAGPRVLVSFCLPCCGTTGQFERGVLRCAECGAYPWEDSDLEFGPSFRVDILTPYMDEWLQCRRLISSWLDYADTNPLEAEVKLSEISNYIADEVAIMAEWSQEGPVSIGAEDGVGSVLDRVRIGMAVVL